MIMPTFHNSSISLSHKCKIQGGTYMYIPLDCGSLDTIVDALCGMITVAFLIYDHIRVK